MKVSIQFIATAQKYSLNIIPFTFTNQLAHFKYARFEFTRSITSRMHKFHALL